MIDLPKLARKITWVLFANQSLASAGFIAAATLNSIVGAALSNHTNWAGVPTAVHLFAFFLAGMVLMGIANAAVQLGRLAAAEVNKPENRGKGSSKVGIGAT